MKKCRVLLCFVLICAFAALTGCKSVLSENPRISEIRDNIFIAQNEQYKVVAVTGVRENPFSIDGVAQKEKQEFTIITVTPANYAAEYSYKAVINETEYSGKLTRHPYNQTYSCEINKRVNGESLSVALNGGAETALTAVSVKGENFIDSEKAYSAAYNRLKGGIKSKAKECDYEIFVRLIENPINSGGGYFWYVAFIFIDDTVLAALIDPITVEIAAVRE